MSNHHLRLGAWKWMTPEKRGAIRKFFREHPDYDMQTIANMFGVNEWTVRYTLRHLRGTK